jgi:hypothetical protein
MEAYTVLVVAMLVQADTKEPIGPVHYNDRVMMPLVGGRAVSVQRAYGASDMETEVPDYKAVFVFPDLSVRQQGRYRLQIDLFELALGEAIHRATVYTLPFRTFTPKKFPGMQLSTETTAELKRNGIKMRYKKSILINNRMKLDLKASAVLSNFTQSMLIVHIEAQETPTTSDSGASYCYNINEKH